jgi:hypothetical protein
MTYLLTWKSYRLSGPSGLRHRYTRDRIKSVSASMPRGTLCFVLTLSCIRDDVSDSDIISDQSCMPDFNVVYSTIANLLSPQ